MSGVYNRLTPSSSESVRRKRQPLQDQESIDPSEAVDLLPDDAELQFEPPTPSANMKLSAMTAGVMKDSHYSAWQTLSTKFDPFFTFCCLIAVCMVIVLMHFWQLTEFTTSKNPFHAPKPSSIITEIDSKTKNFNFTMNDVQPLGFALPAALKNLRQIHDPMQQGDMPFFFHIPRSGGSTVKDIMGTCLGLVIASEAGADHDHESSLQIYSSPWGSKYVNVDMTTMQGIQRAEKLSMVQSMSGMAGLISSPHFYAGASLFNEWQQGR